MFRPENWHSDKWWHDEQYRSAFGPDVTIEIIDRALDEVAAVFNQSWFAKGNWAHPAMYSFGMRGLNPLSYLVSLGLDLRQVSGCLRLPTLVHDLRQASHFQSSRVELMVAALLSQDGHVVEFEPELPNGQRSDLLATIDGRSVFIEVKNLEESDAQAAYRQLSFALTDAISNLQFSLPWSKFSYCGYDVEVTEQVLNLLGDGIEADRATIGAVVNAVASGIRSHFADAKPPFDFSANGYARVRVAPDARGTLSGPVIAAETELKRILRKHFAKPSFQLHPSEPGLMVIKSQSVLNPAMVRDIIGPLLSVRGDSARQLCAVVFLPLSSNMPVPWSMFPPFAVFNPNAIAPAGQLSAYQALAKAFRLHD